MAYNKVLLNDEVLIDLTSDTVTPSNLLTGATAHNKAGVKINGNCTFDSDTSDATVMPNDVLDGKTFYGRGAKGIGTMPNNGSVSRDISEKSEVVSIPEGYHNGEGTIKISESEQEKIVAENITKGVSILGVEGTRRPADDVKSQEKEVTPAFRQQIVTPDSGIDYLSRVKVDPIPFANIGEFNYTITGRDEEVPIPEGYHNGEGTIKIAETERERIVAENIVEGVSILGITGNRRPASDVRTQEKTIIPSGEVQNVLPDKGIDYLSKVTVEPISYSEEENEAGGLTVNIGR